MKNNLAIVDGQNGSYDYQKSLTGNSTFSYKAYPEMLKTICQHYGLYSAITIPAFRLKDREIQKCKNTETVALILRMRDDGIIKISGNHKEDDDKEMIFWAMKNNARIISNDKGLDKHLATLPYEDKIRAEKWLNENTIRFKFYNGEMVLQNYLPRSLKEDET